jgi:hypothetical protein
MIENLCKVDGEVEAEMERALALHGENYMGNITKVLPDNAYLLHDLAGLGRVARRAMERDGDICRVNILLEELGELADALLAGDRREQHEELIQVNAMTLAWAVADEGGTT